MTRYRVGCTGWGYEDWRGGFYPPGLPAGAFLSRYARVFDLTEVDSAYYRAPARSDFMRWRDATPEGFTFTVKLPGAITHEANLRDVRDAFLAYIDAVAPLAAARKLGPLLVQLPARFRRGHRVNGANDEDALEAFLALVPRDLRVAVELRHPSWWTRETYDLLESRSAALVWSVNQHAQTPPAVTTDFLYARFIGDRKLTRFDKVQRNDRSTLEAWRARFEDEGASAAKAYVLLNNHFMGHAPATAALACEVLGVTRPDLSRASREGGQRGLGDYE